MWEAAQKEAQFLITQDLDFSDLRRFAPGTHSGILLVRLRSPDRQSLGRRVRELFQNEEVTSWLQCFVVATDRKIRGATARLNDARNKQPFVKKARPKPCPQNPRSSVQIRG